MDLMTLIALIVAVPLGAIGRRIDGGVLETWGFGKVGKITTRSILAAGMVAPMLLAGLPLWHGLALGAAIWLGAVTGMWSGLGMGRVVHPGLVKGCVVAPGVGPVSLRAWAIAAGFMTVHGVGAVAPAAAVLWWLGLSPWPMLAAGLLCAPVYELAFRWPWHIPRLGCLYWDPPPTAELQWGALRALAGVAIVVIGRVG